MASIRRSIRGKFNIIKDKIYNGILGGSLSASSEGVYEASGSSSKCTVMVFERFSYIGSNRLSLNVTMYQDGDKPVEIIGVSSGGSQGVFLKLNRIGENAFIDKLADLLDDIEKEDNF